MLQRLRKISETFRNPDVCLLPVGSATAATAALAAPLHILASDHFGMALCYDPHQCEHLFCDTIWRQVKFHIPLALFSTESLK